MITTMRTARGVALVLALVSVGRVAGCGGGSGPATPAGAGATTTTTTTTTTTAAVGPRSFGYVNDGLEATLDLDGVSGTVVFKNGRTTPVLTPALYLLDALGVRVDAVLAEASPIEPGDSATLAVRFPPGTDTATAGFFGLDFGDEDAGGFNDR